MKKLKSTGGVSYHQPTGHYCSISQQDNGLRIVNEGLEDYFMDKQFEIDDTIYTVTSVPRNMGPGDAVETNVDLRLSKWIDYGPVNPDVE